MQDLVKRLAEAKGWRAVIEQPVLGGRGSVDVSLERDERRIACEISVASTAEQELGNIQKCLAAGYTIVIVIASEPQFLRTLRQRVVSELPEKSVGTILFQEPEAFVSWLEGQETQAADKVETVRGYRVKVNYTPLAAKQRAQKQQAISKVVVEAMKRLKSNS